MLPAAPAQPKAQRCTEGQGGREAGREAGRELLSVPRLEHFSAPAAQTRGLLSHSPLFGAAARYPQHPWLCCRVCAAFKLLLPEEHLIVQAPYGSDWKNEDGVGNGIVMAVLNVPEHLPTPHLALQFGGALCSARCREVPEGS